MEGPTPEFQYFRFHREIVVDQLVQFGPVIVVDPVGATEARMRQ
jgi:hypothetical protein